MSFVMRKEHNGINTWPLCVYICDSGGLETLPKKEKSAHGERELYLMSCILNSKSPS